MGVVAADQAEFRVIVFSVPQQRPVGVAFLGMDGQNGTIVWLRVFLGDTLIPFRMRDAIKVQRAQFASTDCPFRMSGAGSSVEAVWVLG